MAKLNFEFSEPSDLQEAINAMSSEQKDQLLQELIHLAVVFKTVNGAYTAAIDKVFLGRKRRTVIIDFRTPEFPEIKNHKN